MLKGKTVVLGVTGSIAAYKTASLASSLVKLHADVHVLMTQNATNFINPITFETLTGNKCLVDTFDRNFQFDVTHVSLAKKADVMLIPPASANVIGKIAGGIADDMLTTTVMASTARVLISPAMNTHMYENPIVQDHLETLRRFGYKIIAPAVGMLACRDVGAGKMPEPETLLEWILQEIACEKDLSGKKILITAGPTQESLDPVRYLTNHSTGKMGYAIARVAAARGAEVTLVTGPTEIKKPGFVKVVPIESAREMYEAVTAASEEQDAIIKAAAVGFNEVLYRLCCGRHAALLRGDPYPFVRFIIFTTFCVIIIATRICGTFTVCASIHGAGMVQYQHSCCGTGFLLRFRLLQDNLQRDFVLILLTLNFFCSLGDSFDALRLISLIRSCRRPVAVCTNAAGHDGIILRLPCRQRVHTFHTSAYFHSPFLFLSGDLVGFPPFFGTITVK